mmetsp:Transcript_105764/g.210142  ORF Transcript_105764/g.210142 Transcript_105764/m.210142 type:complete len:309 (-) Transcript_105764:4090-5016(-)
MLVLLTSTGTDTDTTGGVRCWCHANLATFVTCGLGVRGLMQATSAAPRSGRQMPFGAEPVLWQAPTWRRGLWGMASLAVKISEKPGIPHEPRPTGDRDLGGCPSALCSTSVLGSIIVAPVVVIVAPQIDERGECNCKLRLRVAPAAGDIVHEFGPATLLLALLEDSFGGQLTRDEVRVFAVLLVLLSAIPSRDAKSPWRRSDERGESGGVQVPQASPLALSGLPPAALDAGKRGTSNLSCSCAERTSPVHRSELLQALDGGVQGLGVIGVANDTPSCCCCCCCFCTCAKSVIGSIAAGIASGTCCNPL